MLKGLALINNFIRQSRMYLGVFFVGFLFFAVYVLPSQAGHRAEQVDHCDTYFPYPANNSLNISVRTDFSWSGPEFGPGECIGDPPIEYRVIIWKGPAPGWTQVAFCPLTAGTTMTVATCLGVGNDLETSTDYRWRVDYTYDSPPVTHSSLSYWYFTTSPYPDAPGQPSSFAAGAISENNINWSWVNPIYTEYVRFKGAQSIGFVEFFNENINFCNFYSDGFVRACNNPYGCGLESVHDPTYSLACVPTACSGTVTGPTSVIWDWDKGANGGNSPTTQYYASNAAGNTGWQVNTIQWQQSGLSCGTTYTLNVKARNGDLTETVNAVCQATTGACAQPDLVVDSVVALGAPPPDVCNGQSTNLFATVRNIGGVGAGASTAHLRLGTVSCNAAVGALAPGAFAFPTCSVTAPQYGSIVLEGQADFFNNVSEANEGNNLRTTTWTVNDCAAPTILIAPGSRPWANTNVNVTLDASDTGGSGLNAASLQYCWTTGASCVPSVVYVDGWSVTQAGTGNWNICAEACDNDGNCASDNGLDCSGLYQVDKIAPTCYSADTHCDDFVDGCTEDNDNVIYFTGNWKEEGGSGLNTCWSELDDFTPDEIANNITPTSTIGGYIQDTDAATGFGLKVYYMQCADWAGNTSSVCSATMVVDSCPAAAAGPTPANGATNVDVDQNLLWTSTDSDDASLTYYIYYCAGTACSPTLQTTVVFPQGAQASWDPGAMAEWTDHNWSIISSDGVCNTAGPAWTFRTEDSRAPTVTSFTANVSVCEQITWSINGAADPVPGSGLHTTAAYSFTNGSTWQAGNTLVEAVSGGGPVTRTARVRDNALNQWISSATLATASECPPAGPAWAVPNHISNTPTLILWDWLDVSDTNPEDRYELQTSAGAVINSNIAENVTQYNDTGPPTPLASNTQRTVRVRACNTGGCSAWSANASAYTSLQDATSATFSNPTGSTVAVAPVGSFTNLTTLSSGIQLQLVDSATDCTSVVVGPTSNPSPWRQVTSAYTFNNLAENRDYWACVRSRNADGDINAWVGPFGPGTTTESAPPDITLTGVPATWTNVTACVGVACADSGAGCDAARDTLELQNASFACDTSYDAANNYTSCQNVTTRRWACAYGEDLDNNWDNDGPTEILVDQVRPVIDNFRVDGESSLTDPVANTNGKPEIEWIASDLSAGINYVEIWRAPYEDNGNPDCDETNKLSCQWQRIYGGSPGNLPASGLQDDPIGTGNWWYGLHVLDIASNCSLENGNSCASGSGDPILVNVSLTDPLVYLTTVPNAFGAWISQDTQLYVNCSFPGPGCNNSRDGYQIYPTNPVICPTDYFSYTDYTGPIVVNAHRWLCGYGETQGGVAGTDGPRESRIDKATPQINNFNVNDSNQFSSTGNILVAWEVSDTGDSGLDDIVIWRYAGACSAAVANNWSGANLDVVDVTSVAPPGTPAISSHNASKTQTGLLDGVYCYGLHARDWAGNDGTETASGLAPFEVTVDASSPILTADPSGSVWQPSAGSIALQAQDLGSFVSNAKYAFHASGSQPANWAETNGVSFGGGSQTVNANVTMPGCSTYYLYLWAADAGGLESTLQTGPYRCDNTLPNITAFNVNNNNYNNTSGNVDVNWTVTDAGGSGLKETVIWRYFGSCAQAIASNWSGANQQTTAISATAPGPGSDTRTVGQSGLSDGTYCYGLHVFDWAGNERTESSSVPALAPREIKVDSLPPVLSATPRDSGGWKTSLTSINVQAQDLGSDVQEARFAWDPLIAGPGVGTVFGAAAPTVSAVINQGACNQTRTLSLWAIDGGGLVATLVEEPYQCDNIYPTLNTFTIEGVSYPSVVSVTGGDPDIAWTSADPALPEASLVNYVEVWRTTDLSGAPNPANWVLLGSAGQNGAFTDTGVFNGTYWYGLHILDNAGNCTREDARSCGGSLSSGTLIPSAITRGPIRVNIDRTSANFSWCSLNSQAVLFTDLSVPGGATSIRSWAWNFGDGFGCSSAMPDASCKNPGHAYPGTLTYNTQLTVTDTGSGSDSITLPVTPGQNSCNAPFCPGNPSPTNGAIDVSGTPILSWTGGHPLGTPVQYYVYLGTSQALVELGDASVYQGTTAYGVTTFSPGNLAPNTQYFWKIVADDGTYFTDSASDVCSGAAWNFTTAGAVGDAPVAAFVYCRPNPSGQPRTIKFFDTSSDSDGVISSWFWNFGDGSTDTLPHPEHTYAVAGSYDVDLSVTDNTGNLDSEVVTINTVTAPACGFLLTNVSATSCSVISLAWEAAIGADSYQIYRNAVLFTTLDAQDTSICGQFGCAWADNSVSPNMAYQYYVRAIRFDASGWNNSRSAPSCTGNAVTTCPLTTVTPLCVASGVTAVSPVCGQMHVSWNSNSAALGYNVYRAVVDSPGSYDIIASSAPATWCPSGCDTLTPATADNYIDRDILSDVPYFYQVSIVVDDGLGGTVEGPMSSSASGVSECFRGPTYIER